MIAEPHAVYKRVDEGEYEVKMNVTVKGGEPKPQVSFTIQHSKLTVETINTFFLDFPYAEPNGRVKNKLFQSTLNNCKKNGFL